jgi:formate dehydrogenase major subunit
LFFEVPKASDLWRKLRSHAGTTVKHSVSPATEKIRSRLSDEGVKKTESICPYCAVGCSTLVYHRDGRIIDIEGNPDSPINAGTLCPKGSATFGMHVSPHRWTKVKYRRPYSEEWEDLDIETAMENEDGKKLSRSMKVASVGGAAIDNEENYLITKLFHSMGFTRITNQARI